MAVLIGLADTRAVSAELAQRAAVARDELPYLPQIERFLQPMEPLASGQDDRVSAN